MIKITNTFQCSLCLDFNVIMNDDICKSKKEAIELAKVTIFISIQRGENPVHRWVDSKEMGEWSFLVVRDEECQEDLFVNGDNGFDIRFENSLFIIDEWIWEDENDR